MTCPGSHMTPSRVVARHFNSYDEDAAYDWSRPTGAGVCPACGRERSLRLDGTLAKHEGVS